jgi:hypothetical protein
VRELGSSESGSGGLCEQCSEPSGSEGEGGGGDSSGRATVSC